MPSIPVAGFPSDFKPHCPKCRSVSSLHFNLTKHVYMWNVTEPQFSCKTCGSIGYGEERIRALFEPQLQDWLREQRERAEQEARIAERAAIAAAEAEAAEARRREAAAMARRARENEERVAAALERRREESRERKRRYDRERSARIRSAFKELRQAAAATPEVEEAAPVQDQAPQPTKCAWHACESPRTPTSKYCSRRCSNRNSSLNAKLKAATAHQGATS
jgi:hypothetical protein